MEETARESGLLVLKRLQTFNEVDSSCNRVRIPRHLLVPPTLLNEEGHPCLCYSL